MTVFTLLAPIFIIIALGAVLQWRGMMSTDLATGINRILYWVGLPAAVFHALVAADATSAHFGALLGVMATATVLNGVWIWIIAPRLGVAQINRGSFVQASSRGNLSFIALPLLLSVPGVPIGPAMLAFAPMLIIHNGGTVLALLASKESAGWKMWRPVARGFIMNPIILAAVAGAAVHAMGWRPELALMRTLQALAQMSLPLALLCIGATLMTVPVRGNRRLPAIAAAHKVVVAPVLGYLLGRWAGLDADTMLAALICLSCPTAAISLTMVKQLGGDEALTATTIVYSSIASAASLGVIIALFAS
jgi:predicted permease